MIHSRPRKVRPGAFALDSRGSILHFDPAIQDWGSKMIKMANDIELLMLGMVEIKVINRLGRDWYYPTSCNPYYLYANFGSQRYADQGSDINSGLGGAASVCAEQGHARGHRGRSAF